MSALQSSSAGGNRVRAIIAANMPVDAAPPHPPGPLSAGLGLRLWRGFCALVVRVFYNRMEVEGARFLPAAGPLVVCANHVSALADAVILQTASPRPLHPLARSGLFANPILRPLLAVQGAVPVYRQQDVGADTTKNAASFARCVTLLERGEALLIFPEGQSHSDPSLRPFKTGAARIALAALQSPRTVAPLVPAGITFSARGRFRGAVLVQFGSPLDARPLLGEEPEDAVRRVTAELVASLRKLTLNADAWSDLQLVQQVQRFFALEHGSSATRHSLAHRFRAQRRLIEALHAVRARAPERVVALSQQLQRFERLCHRFGVRNYHLDAHFTIALVSSFLLRSLFFAAVVFPLALWGALNSALPFYGTRHASLRLAKGPDQYDTSQILIGLVLFPVFWGSQTYAILQLGSLLWTAIYAASLPLTAAVAFTVRKERKRIFENVRVFFLFSRRHNLRDYLRGKRAEINRELAAIAKLARRGTKTPESAPPG
jgi:glycerol-3-phosphate O-acyltransferase / dihydroxyacetone phosphate acyltransferase